MLLCFIVADINSKTQCKFMLRELVCTNVNQTRTKQACKVCCYLHRHTAQHILRTSALCASHSLTLTTLMASLSWFQCLQEGMA